VKLNVLVFRGSVTAADWNIDIGFQGILDTHGRLPDKSKKRVWSIAEEMIKKHCKMENRIIVTGHSLGAKYADELLSAEFSLSKRIDLVVGFNGHGVSYSPDKAIHLRMVMDVAAIVGHTDIRLGVSIPEKVKSLLKGEWKKLLSEGQIYFVFGGHSMATIVQCLEQDSTWSKTRLVRPNLPALTVSKLGKLVTWMNAGNTPPGYDGDLPPDEASKFNIRFKIDPDHNLTMVDLQSMMEEYGEAAETEISKEHVFLDELFGPYLDYLFHAMTDSNLSICQKGGFDVNDQFRPENIYGLGNKQFFGDLVFDEKKTTVNAIPAIPGVGFVPNDIDWDDDPRLAIELAQAQMQIAAAQAFQ